MRVSEFSTFNQNYSLGMDLLSEPNIQNYFTLDSITGQPIANPISNSGGQSSYGNMSESYRLYDNGIYAVKTNNFDNISSEHYGSYRLQQNPDAPNIITTGGNIVNFPIFNANNNELTLTDPITGTTVPYSISSIFRTVKRNAAPNSTGSSFFVSWPNSVKYCP